MSRISRDEMFMRIAEIVALRGTCDRAQVGALMVVNKRIISIGYNGSHPGEPHCDDVGHLLDNGHCVRTVHAEVNCLNFAHKYLVDYYNANKIDAVHAIMYVTHLPCEACCKYIVEHNKQFGSYIKVKQVIYGRKYPADIPEWKLEERMDFLRQEGGLSKVEQYQV